MTESQEVFSDIVCRFFATKVGWVNARRIVVITSKSFLSFDETDGGHVLREQHAIKDLKSIVNVAKGAKGAISHEFSLQWGDAKEKESYLCDGKDYLLAQLMRLWTQVTVDNNWMGAKSILSAAPSSSSSLPTSGSNMPNPNPISLTLSNPYLSKFYGANQLYKNGESKEWLIAVGPSFIIKLDPSQANASIPKLSSLRLLCDVSKIVKFAKGTDISGLEIQFVDGSLNRFTFQKDERSLMLHDVRKSIADCFGIEPLIEEKHYNEIVQPANNFIRIEGEIIYKAIVSKFSQKSNKIVNRVLFVTNSHIALQNEIESFTYYCRPISNLSCLRASGEDTFQIEWTNGKISGGYKTPLREVFLSTIMEVRNWSGNSPISIFYSEKEKERNGSNCFGWKFGTPTSSFAIETKEYFLRRLYQLTEKTKTEELSFVINEFIHNIPLWEERISRDKKLTTQIVSLLKLKSLQSKDVGDISGFLNLLHRLLTLYGGFDVVTKIQNLVPIIMNLLQSPDERIASTAARLLRSCVIHKFSAKNPNQKWESYNKTFFFTDENVAAILALMMRSANSNPEKTALFSCLLSSILECMLKSTFQTTPRPLFKKLIRKFMDFIEIMFQLGRSPCVPVTRYSSIILYKLFKNSSDQVYKHIQVLARTSQALIWQIALALDSPIPEQRQISSSLVEMMADGDLESMKLLSRMFPSDLMKSFHSQLVENHSFLSDLQKNLNIPNVHIDLNQINKTVNNISTKVTGKSITSGPTKHFSLSDQWEKFFKDVMEDYETPVLIWNELTRRELTFWIEEELLTFELEKRSHPKLKYIWNYEEFTVTFNCIATELKVGPYFINVILKNLPNCKVEDPGTFLEKLFYNLLMETITETRISFLKVMTWLMEEYNKEIEPLKFMTNIVYLLRTLTSSDVIGHLFFFLKQAFKQTANMLAFIEHGGAIELIKHVSLIHLPKKEGKLHPYRIGTACIELLLQIASIQKKHTDAKGYIISPVPRLKRQLSMPQHLPHVVQLLAVVVENTISSSSSSTSASPSSSMNQNSTNSMAITLFQLAVNLLDYLIEFNEMVVSSIFKTGIFFFLIRNIDADPIGVSKLLLKIHLKQSICPNQSILKLFFPSYLIKLLVQDGPTIFIEKFNGESELEPMIWTPLMKKHLLASVDNYLWDFKSRLQTNNRKAVFEYIPFSHISYTQFNVQEEEIPWEADERSEYEQQKKKEEERAQEKKRRDEERLRNLQQQQQQQQQNQNQLPHQFSQTNSDGTNNVIKSNFTQSVTVPISNKDAEEAARQEEQKRKIEDQRFELERLKDEMRALRQRQQLNKEESAVFDSKILEKINSSTSEDEEDSSIADPDLQGEPSKSLETSSQVVDGNEIKADHPVDPNKSWEETELRIKEETERRLKEETEKRIREEIEKRLKENNNPTTAETPAPTPTTDSTTTAPPATGDKREQLLNLFAMFKKK